MRNLRKAIGFLVIIFLFITATPRVCLAADGEQVINTWQTKASMSTIRKNLCTEVINGKIYAIGGSNDTAIIGITEVYDPATDKWTSLEPMPTARTYFQTEILNGKIYAIGGVDNVNTLIK